MLVYGLRVWKIASGWWERGPAEFAGPLHLHWCEICRFALHVLLRDATDEIYNASPSVYEMFEKTRRLRLKARRVNKARIQDGNGCHDGKIVRPYEI